MRDQPSYATDGAVRGTGPLAGSASGVDHQAHRQEVFGKYREMDVKGPDTRRQNGSPNCDPVTDQEAEDIYIAYWSTESTMREVAREFDRSPRTVGHVANRERRFREPTSRAAARLGYPEEADS